MEKGRLVLDAGGFDTCGWGALCLSPLCWSINIYQQMAIFSFFVLLFPHLCPLIPPFGASSSTALLFTSDSNYGGGGHVFNQVFCCAVKRGNCLFFSIHYRRNMIVMVTYSTDCLLLVVPVSR